MRLQKLGPVGPLQPTISRPSLKIPVPRPRPSCAFRVSFFCQARLWSARAEPPQCAPDAALPCLYRVAAFSSFAQSFSPAPRHESYTSRTQKPFFRLALYFYAIEFHLLTSSPAFAIVQVQHETATNSFPLILLGSHPLITFLFLFHCFDSLFSLTYALMVGRAARQNSPPADPGSPLTPLVIPFSGSQRGSVPGAIHHFFTGSH